MSSIGAFFDIDGTLYRNSLMIEHFKKLMKYEVIDPALWHTKVKKTYENWEKRRGNYDDYLLELADVYINALKGLDKNMLEFITNQVIERKGDNVYVYTRERIRWHKERNHRILFISGSPSFLVRKMAEKYGVDDYKASFYEVDSLNRFTGEIRQMWDSENKKKAMDTFVKDYTIDLSKSYAYGDTTGDLSMFEMVAHPVAINPTKELLLGIKARKDLSDRTEIIVERKDLIYHLDASVDIEKNRKI